MNCKWLPKDKAKGIFCLEGDWAPDLRAYQSVLPVLHLMRDGQDVPYIHRNVGTRPELEYYLSRWTLKKYDRYPILYLAFHGDPSLIEIPGGRGEDRHMSLEELSRLLAGKCCGRIVHFGTCSTVNVHGRNLNRFLKETEALAICGYTKYIDWVASTALDLIIFDKMQKQNFNPKGAEKIFKKIKEDASGLVGKLGFRMKINYY